DSVRRLGAARRDLLVTDHSIRKLAQGLGYITALLKDKDTGSTRLLLGATRALDEGASAAGVSCYLECDALSTAREQGGSLQRRRPLDLVGGRIPTKVADDAQHEPPPISARHRVN